MFAANWGKETVRARGLRFAGLLLLAIFLAALATVFAANTQAAVSTGGTAPVAAGAGVPSTPTPSSPKLTSTAKTSGGTPAADPAPSDASSHGVQTPKARVVPPRSRAPRAPASSLRSPDRPGPATRSNIDDVAKAVSSLPSVARGTAAAVLRVAAPVAASEQPAAGTSPSAQASQPATTPASPAPAGEPPTGTPSPAAPDQETEMLEREREAETISASWPSPLSAEEPAAAELAQDLQSFIGQYQSLE